MRVTELTTRPVVIAAVLASFSFLVAACGATPAHNAVARLGNTNTATTKPSAPSGSSSSRSSSSGSSGPTEAQLLRYAVCMRSHGLSNFPDPVPAQGGGFAFRVAPGLNPRSPSPQFQAATTACQKDVPPSLANLTPAMMAANALKYSDCMRSHGEPDFPDPDAQGMIKLNPTGVMSPGSPEFQKAEKACQPLNNGGFDEEMTAG